MFLARSKSEPDLLANDKKGKMQKLLQAIIDDEGGAVKFILDNNPELLLENPKDLGIKEIKSLKNNRLFVAEMPLLQALNGKLVGMIEIFSSYLNKMQQKEQETAMSQVSLDEQEHKEQDEAVKILKDWVKTTILYNRLKKESGQESQTTIGEQEDKSQNEAPRNIGAGLLDTFKEQLSSAHSVRIDQYDTLQLLLAAYEIYNKAFLQLKPEQLKIYASSVLGVIEPLLLPEVAKDYRKKVSDVVALTAISDDVHGISLKAEALTRKLVEERTTKFQEIENKILVIEDQDEDEDKNGFCRKVP